MQSSDIPAKFPIPFASGAGSSYIRAIPKDHVAPTTTDAPASLHDGFPPETFTPLGSGGVPVSGADMNGILNQLSAWQRWLQAGVPAVYDATFSTAIGGYPIRTVLASTTPGKFWQSTAENNATDPDGGSPANWVAVAGDFGSDPNLIRYPNGKIDQWGYVASSSTGEPVVSVTFPVAFANANYGVSLVPCLNGASGVADTWVQLIRGTKATTGFSVQYQRPGGSVQPNLDGFEWRCVGQG